MSTSNAAKTLEEARQAAANLLSEIADDHDVMCKLGPFLRSLAEQPAQAADVVKVAGRSAGELLAMLKLREDAARVAFDNAQEHARWSAGHPDTFTAESIGRAGVALAQASARLEEATNARLAAEGK